MFLKRVTTTLYPYFTRNSHTRRPSFHTPAPLVWRAAPTSPTLLADSERPSQLPECLTHEAVAEEMNHIKESADANWWSGRSRILAQCDAKFTAARATYGGEVAGELPGHVQRTIASIRVGRVECLCKGGAATATAAERQRAGVGWEARVRKVDAFSAIAAMEGDGVHGAGEMMVEPTVALFKMLCKARMADLAWEGVEQHVLRAMVGEAEARVEDISGCGSGGGGGEKGEEQKGGTSGAHRVCVAASKWRSGHGGKINGKINGLAVFEDARGGEWRAVSAIRVLLGRLLDIDNYGRAGQ